MSNKQKLELTWIGKENRPRLEPRILLEDPKKSCHARHRVTKNDIFDNRLIFGDNLLALKALEQEFAGKVKCVYIDPPFNTQQAFEHYDDGLEHSIWLSLLRNRVEILHRLLSASGSFFVHIDDNELGYLMAISDEIFGRTNRISVITFKQSSASGPKSINPGLVTTTNYLLYYVKNKAEWNPNRIFVPTSRDGRYSKFIENIDDPYEKWRLCSLKEAFLRVNQLPTWDDARAKYLDKIEEKLSVFVLENARCVVRTARVAPKDVNESARMALRDSTKLQDIVQGSQREDKEDYFFLNGEQLIFYKTKTKLIDGNICTASPLTNLWDDLLSNNLHNEGGVRFPNGKKPEGLIKRCIELSTNPGDLVLDSFAGSGTTGAVAHKMGRRWIMVELGDHCHTHIIPRILVVPGGEVKTGFKSFTLDLKALNYPAVSDDLWIQHLRTSQLEVLAMGQSGLEETKPEDYVVSGLVDFDDISYDDQAELLYNLAEQVVRHFQSYLSEDETRKVLRCRQKEIARFVHAQMQEHYWEDAVEYKVLISKGFTELKETAYSYSKSEPPMNYRVSPEDKSNMSKYLFAGFERCLYPVQKFAAEAERRLAVILEREAVKWFKPVLGQFQIFYRHNADYSEYQPDFIAETADSILMLEPKASNQMEDPIVLAKKEAAVKWCANATNHARSFGGKSWRYVLIPHTEIAENITLEALTERFGA